MEDFLRQLGYFLVNYFDEKDEVKEEASSDFTEGDEVQIINVKDGEIEELEGVITDSYLVDKNGEPYARAITEEGRKFRGSVKNGETRNGTRFTITCHARDLL